ncbi:MAG: hypothetical protein IJH75_01075 [Mogibacterium sp.]|nr:hypothetical protein [Mogibacterium sp.]
MDRRKSTTAFYLETLLMILIFVCIILILTRVFAAARLQSVEARRMTVAVTLAENAAEAALAADSEDDLAGILSGKTQNAPVLTAGDSAGRAVTASFDDHLEPSADGPYRVEITWEPEGRQFVRNRITVCFGTVETPLFTMETGSYKPGLPEPAPGAESPDGNLADNIVAGAAGSGEGV